MRNFPNARKSIGAAIAIVIVTAFYAFRVPEWTKGLDSSFLVYGRSAGCEYVTFVPQIAIGSFDGGSTTYTTIVNVQPLDRRPSPIWVNFYTAHGPDPVLKFR